MNRLNQIKDKFNRIFDTTPSLIIRAPGRVNLIGEHTDYNDGFVFPIAINRDIIYASTTRTDRQVHLYSFNFNRSTHFSLDDIQYDKQEPWSNYIRGVAHFLQEEGIKLTGLNTIIEGNIPIGAGLSSSAAMEVGAAYTFQLLNQFDIPPVQMALLCQKAENQFVGMRCGIMDQFISTLGKKDHALFIDCRTLKYQLIPLNLKNCKIVVCDTTVKRGLLESEYNTRRSECEQGATILAQFLPHVKALRDVTPDQFLQYRQHLTAQLQKRCQHIIYENQRVLNSLEALKHGNLNEFGNLMNQSHQSLRDYYQVSCYELDVLVEAARKINHVLGARLTGAGFGGCTVNLVKDEALNEFKARVTTEYQQKTNLTPLIYICEVEDGVSEISE